MEEHVIHTTATLFGSYTIPKKKKATERGELLSYFSKKLGRPIPYVAFKVTSLKMPDLYFIKSSCDQAEQRGIAWGAAFHTSLSTPTH